MARKTLLSCFSTPSILKDARIIQGPARMTNKADKVSFRLSRIYAEGWNAARCATLENRTAANPYQTEPERTRWNEGFAEAAD